MVLPPWLEVPVCPGPRWRRSVVVLWWSPGDAVSFVGSDVPLVWPHAPAGGSAGQPVMVAEPPVAPAALDGLSWVRIDALDALGYRWYWARQGGGPWSDSPGRLGVLGLDP